MASRFDNPIKLLFKCYRRVLPRDENVRVPSPRDNVIKLHLKKVQVHIQVYKESNIFVFVIIILFIFIKKVLTCEIK